MRTYLDTIERITHLIKEITEKGDAIPTSLQESFPIDKQEELSEYLMDIMGLDRAHTVLSTSEHPFTTSLGSHADERITTHYLENDFISSMFSVIHEGGMPFTIPEFLTNTYTPS